MNEHTRKAAARFDAWADTYGQDRIAGWFTFYQAFALERLNLSPNGNFLDVGCGPGWAVRKAREQILRGKVCGIDISPKMIDKAKAQAQTASNVEFHVAPVHEIPYPDGFFRSVLCTLSFHHYHDPLNALLEIKRIMEPDGKIVLLDSARDVSLPIWIQDRWRRYLERSHVKYYTTRELKTLIERAGLHLVGKIVTIQRFMFHGKVFTGLMVAECKKLM